MRALCRRMVRRPMAPCSSSAPLGAAGAVDAGVSAYALAGCHARARLGHLAPVGRRSLIAPAVGAMAVLVVLPIRFGNVLPALALMLVGLGLVAAVTSF